MRLAARSIILTLFLTFASDALARSYIVEVIIFERGSAPAQAEEAWRPGSNQAQSRSLNLQSLERVAKTPNTLSATSRLKRLEGALTGSGNRILKSARWALNARTYQNATTFNLSTSELKAFLKIYKTSLIFADIDLGLISRTPVYNNVAENSVSGTPTSPSTNQTTSSITSLPTTIATASPRPVVSNEPLFFIHEKRRLKFKEIHYFDHPRFGAILGVWPAG